MNFSSLPEILTHTRDNTPDLIWSNCGALVDKVPDPNFIFDRYTLTRDVPKLNTRVSAAIRLSRIIQVENSPLDKFIKLMSEWSKSIGRPSLSSTLNVDKLADNIVELFRDAVRAT